MMPQLIEYDYIWVSECPSMNIFSACLDHIKTWIIITKIEFKWNDFGKMYVMWITIFRTTYSTTKDMQRNVGIRTKTKTIKKEIVRTQSGAGEKNLGWPLK